MALRCPECVGQLVVYSMDGSRKLVAREVSVPMPRHPGEYIPLTAWESVRVKIKEKPCSTCHGTGWRIPLSLPKQVLERLERFNFHPS